MHLDPHGAWEEDRERDHDYDDDDMYAQPRPSLPGHMPLGSLPNSNSLPNSFRSGVLMGGSYQRGVVLGSGGHRM
jgi:hypothetical protein